jgi:hypothetical protein
MARIAFSESAGASVQAAGSIATPNGEPSQVGLAKPLGSQESAHLKKETKYIKK